MRELMILFFTQHNNTGASRPRFKNQVEQVTSRFLTEGHKY